MTPGPGWQLTGNVAGIAARDADALGSGRMLP